ncbi:hypothetical protein BIV57_16695 [Mangrovactinospora gilvigrisea]|uniref:Cell envelope-related transcriptional attenuator domain-containing protein n=1 Tax=Mangrovactinospora gilvigrisea TaxID=1428644 RepID=A0A1J7C472_9ACTN|nr:hypothetical protein BIV57_16695 [Mangrovactinospora gilvigrisea]
MLSGVLVLVLAVGGGAWWYISGLTGGIGHAKNVFDRSKLNGAGERPAADPAAGKAMNILMVGSDTRDGATTGSEGKDGFKTALGNRTDTMILMHVPSDRSAISSVSIPRDSWVPIPGHGEAKINAALSWGGPNLLVATVENLTKVRVDHYVAVDFEGFKTTIDQLGGVDITLDQALHDPQQKVSFSKGRNHFDGATALKFVRQRHGLPRGDFDRVVHQQMLLSAVAGKVLSQGVLSHPLKTRELLGSMTNTMTVDDGFSLSGMAGLAGSLKGIKQTDLEFRTIPTTGTGWRQKQSVVLLDPTRDAQLFDAIRKDTAWPDAKPSETWTP